MHCQRPIAKELKIRLKRLLHQSTTIKPRSAQDRTNNKSRRSTFSAVLCIYALSTPDCERVEAPVWMMLFSSTSSHCFGLVPPRYSIRLQAEENTPAAQFLISCFSSFQLSKTVILSTFIHRGYPEFAASATFLD